MPAALSALLALATDILGGCTRFTSSSVGDGQIFPSSRALRRLPLALHREALLVAGNTAACDRHGIWTIAVVERVQRLHQLRAIGARLVEVELACSMSAVRVARCVASNPERAAAQSSPRVCKRLPASFMKLASSAAAALLGYGAVIPFVAAAALAWLVDGNKIGRAHV